jgi:hypothetical protein
MVSVGPGPMHGLPAEHRADHPRVGAVLIRGDAFGGDVRDGPGRAKESLQRGGFGLARQLSVGRGYEALVLELRPRVAGRLANLTFPRQAGPVLRFAEIEVMPRR